MRYSIIFLALGATLAALAVAAWPGAGVLCAWPGLSFTILGAAYLARRPSWLGKRLDGTLAGWAYVLLGPYLALTWLLWRLERQITREPAADEIVPGLWVGRRPVAEDLPAGLAVIVDMTAELREARAVRAHAGYLCAPTLDAEPPDAALFRSLVQRLRDQEGVLVHCASGHGRSATLAAALLIARGIAPGVAEAEDMLRARRPGIGLRASQRSAILAAIDRGPRAGSG